MMAKTGHVEIIMLLERELRLAAKKTAEFEQANAAIMKKPKTERTEDDELRYFKAHAEMAEACMLAFGDLAAKDHAAIVVMSNDMVERALSHAAAEQRADDDTEVPTDD